ncbi:MAG: insulinase family protein [Thermodesulfobacteriota bacterium]
MTTQDFKLVTEQWIPEISSNAKLFAHVKTGARVLSLTNDDENKVFGISFRTPPRDNTGVAHILEHSVLCGSRKYPSKEPFVELLKGSLQTFLNAMTFPDKTCYPVASQNIQDFYNLMDVYLDAVFYPRITPEIFAQEGWHLELENKEAPLKYKGVVYNEMKGAYSSPDSLLGEYTQQSLFPDSTYGLDSGGDPKNIPELTYEDFQEFHRRFYHPSNAWIFMYGDDPEEQRLEKIGEYLNQFEKLDVDSKIHMQPEKELRTRIKKYYSASPDQVKNGSMLTVNWLLPETADITTNIALRILNYILTGMPASPLRKKLIDSGLGEDLTGCGLETELKQIFYSTGLKGVNAADMDKVEKLILSTMDELASAGLDQDIIDAAMNRIEFNLRENNTGSFPRGLAVMLRSLTTWLYDGSPFDLLHFEPHIKKIKDRLQNGEKLFEKLLRDYFVDNAHRTTLELHPDTGLEKRLLEEEKGRLDAIRKQMDNEQLGQVMTRTRTLKDLQSAPDSPENLARIPRLNRDDLEKKIKHIPMEKKEIEGLTVLSHELSTSGIVYLDLGLNLHLLPQKYASFIPLFGRVLLESGTDREDFSQLTTRIRRECGGLSAVPFVHQVKDQRDSTAWLFLRGKALSGQTDKLLQILTDILTSTRLDNKERFRKIVLEEKAMLEQILVPAGHQIVAARLKARFTEAGWAQEHMNGISYLLFLRHLLTRIDSDWNGVLHCLQDIHHTLVNKDALFFNITAEKNDQDACVDKLKRFISGFENKEISHTKWIPRCLPGHEGITLPAQVNYVGKAVDLYEAGYEFHGAALVASKYLRTGHLWEKIRVMGGAYGAFCTFDHLAGVMTFLSYRDPNITETLAAFDSSAEHLLGETLSGDELEKAVIGTIGDMDAYQLPEAKGFTSMTRYLAGIDDSQRQTIRDEVLSCDRDQIEAFASALNRAIPREMISVMGSAEKIAQARKDGVELENVFPIL